MSFNCLFIVMATKETSLQLQRIQIGNEQYISCAVVSDQSQPLYINLDRAAKKLNLIVIDCQPTKVKNQ